MKCRFADKWGQQIASEERGCFRSNIHESAAPLYQIIPFEQHSLGRRVHYKTASVAEPKYCDGLPGAVSLEKECVSVMDEGA